ncbi:tetratricopeptide repeat protein [Candidatus Sumerlaeota bacterium]|nr:tetratricopeptide repeat protein [Candidatus Sumerlaeota bacterium]
MGRKKIRGSRKSARDVPPSQTGPPQFAKQNARPGLRLLIPVALAVAGFLVYSNSFSGVFLFDDEFAITNNETIRALSPRALWGPDETGVSGRPLVNLSLAINYAISGYKVWSYHWFNLIVHLSAGLALYGLIARTLRLEILQRSFAQGAETYAAAIALLWLVHPIQTEPVNYIIIRNESLMGFFYIFTLYSFVRSLEQKPHLRWGLTAIAACAAGMLSKETMATAPIAALLYDWVYVARGSVPMLKSRFRIHAGLFSTWLIFFAVLASGPRTQSTGFGLTMFTPIEYARTEFGVVLHYLRLCFWPYPLVLDYHWPIAIRAEEYIPQAVVILALLAATCLALWWRPTVGFCGAMFFLILAPTSSIMPTIETAWEYRMYLPSAGVLSLAVFGVDKLLRRAGIPKLNLLCLALAAISFGTLTFLRNRDYSDELRMYLDTITKRPINSRAYINLGKTYEKRHAWDLAIESYRKAVEINPDSWHAQYNLGTLLLIKGDLDEAQPCFERAITIKPEFVDARNNMAVVYLRKNMLLEAKAQCERALQIDPNSVNARGNLAEIEHRLSNPSSAP